MASATQSVGLPLLAKAALPSARWVEWTRKGLCIVLAWPEALQLRSGASTTTSAIAISACFKASSPGELTPSSLVTRIVGMGALFRGQWSVVSGSVSGSGH